MQSFLHEQSFVFLYACIRLGTSTAAMFVTGVGSDTGNIDLYFFLSQNMMPCIKQQQKAQEGLLRQPKQLDDDKMSARIGNMTNNNQDNNNNNDEYDQLIERKAEFENAGGCQGT